MKTFRAIIPNQDDGFSFLGCLNFFEFVRICLEERRSDCNFAKTTKPRAC